MKKFLRNLLTLYFIVIFLFITFSQNRILCSEKKIKEKFTGIYLGKTPPGSKAGIFDSGEITGDMRLFNFSFSPDGKYLFYFARHGKERANYWISTEVIKNLRKIKVESQITCIHTNTYLVYSLKSREAALIDVAGPVDTLLAIVRNDNLNLKYILVTHGHFDHSMGIPEIRKKFPEVKVCMSRQAYEDLLIQKKWGIENFGKEWIKTMKKNPRTRKMLEFNPETIGEPDVFLVDGQKLTFGDFKINAIFTPGHSRGHICFSINSALFSGDVLSYRSVGHTGWLGGSEEQLIASVRRLYNIFPDETIVYPGHGQVTDIGTEKTENQKVRMDKN